jgi:hypothetical protein
VSIKPNLNQVCFLELVVELELEFHFEELDPKLDSLLAFICGNCNQNQDLGKKIEKKNTRTRCCVKISLRVVMDIFISNTQLT